MGLKIEMKSRARGKGSLGKLRQAAGGGGTEKYATSFLKQHQSLLFLNSVTLSHQFFCPRLASSPSSLEQLVLLCFKSPAICHFIPKTCV